MRKCRRVEKAELGAAERWGFLSPGLWQRPPPPNTLSCSK